MVDINIPKIVKSYVPLHRSTPLNAVYQTANSQYRTFEELFSEHHDLRESVSHI